MSSAKIKVFFRITMILSKENEVKKRRTRCMRKVVDFLSILLFFGGKTPSFFEEIRVFVFRSSLPVCFLTRAGVPERTRARASRTQRV